ncbi:unnamed protein product [Ranitomeya imitator]|uniref:Uncharacterized protein n=1 Tax=Ranitomeya imitator TaxID=111125 RepID=A0ABN9MPT3_9NEOB|nr:unnamed protein product [Ranitomeya imitator]
MDSGPEELMLRLLPVGDSEPMDDFDPAAPPRTLQEYLRRIDPKKRRKRQTVSIALSRCQPAPEGYSPSLRWQQQQVSQFSAV